jgi:hypothetical protein
VIKVCSGLVLILGLTVAAGQQPPAKDEKPPHQKAPPTDELEAAIAASANHPDVRMAQAKLQMAQAELDQAKLQAVQRLASAHAKMRSAQTQVEIEEKNYRQVSQLSSVPQQEKWQLERALAQAKAALAAAEAEWQAARGQPPGRVAATKDATATAALLSRLVLDDVAGARREQLSLSYLDLVNRAAAPVPGSAADKLRELLHKQVKLGDLKGVHPQDAIKALRTAAGTDLMIRGIPEDGTLFMHVTGGELPFIA